MKKIIQCQEKTESHTQRVRVKIIKAPFVDTAELKKILFARARALVL